MSETKSARPRGAGTVYLRGNTWWIRYWHRGKEHRESSKGPDESKAQKLLDRRTKEIWADRQGLQSFTPKAEKVYVDTLLDALEKEFKREGKHSPATRSHLKHVRRAFGNMRALAVTAKRIDEYIDRRLEDEGKAPATVNRETQLLGQAFNLAIKRGELAKGQAPHIKYLSEVNVRQGFFERAEFDALVGALPEDLQDFTRFAYLSGWRKGEIASLTWADVDRDGRIIRLRGENAKNGHPRKLALEGELAVIIERRWNQQEYQKPTGETAVCRTYVFHRDGLAVNEFRKSWASACKAAGLVVPAVDENGSAVTELVDGEERPVMVPARIFHDLRRTAVRNMVRAGVREGVAMSISGHRTRTVFERYNITSEEDLREAVIRTQQHIEAQPAKAKVVSIGRRDK